MRKFSLKIRAAWKLLLSKGYILIHVKDPKAEELDAGFYFSGLDGEQIILFCDTLADDIEQELQDEEDEMMSNRIGQGMINYINLN